ncbi:MAG: response regulator [Planctomycetes bacterium]|nr:response regulator [Planctomycetota bacterium]
MGWKTYAVAVLLALLPLLALGLATYSAGAAQAERLVVRSNKSASAMAATLVETEFDYWTDTVEGFSRLPGLREAFKKNDPSHARVRLQILIESHPRANRAFLTDKTGTLWADFPVAPESQGVNFSDRDWFKGAARIGGSYVSGVYQRNAKPQILSVAVATPVRDEGGVVLGFVVAQVPLQEFGALLQRVNIGEGGFIVMVDHNGVLASRPGINLRERERHEYADSAAVEAPINGDPVNLRYNDPISGQEMLATATATHAGPSRWIVISQQPTEQAFAPIRAAALQTVISGLILGAVAVGAFFWLARVHNGMRRLNQRLSGINVGLGRQVEEGRAAADALSADRATLKRSAEERLAAADTLRADKAELERRVEERTRELHLKEEQLMQSQKMEAIGRLAGGVAHDFNNLLTVILGYAELVLELMPKDAPHRMEIEQMRDAGARAAALTRQLLAFSRKQVVQLQLIDVNDVVTHMEKMLRRLIGEDIDLSCKRAPGLPPVMFDPGQIEQVIMNLVVNARDAMPRGGKLTIETATVELDEEYCRQHVDARPGPHVMLAITDTGTGMTPEVLPRIFEPFFTTKERGHGTGLGLATVYGIVKQAGGNIWVYSELGRGTTFKIYFPVATRPAQAEVAAPIAAASKGTETILVVDDEAAVRGLVENVLRNAGYTVLVEGHPRAAIETLKRNVGKVALLVTDVVMPEMAGPDMAREMQALQPKLKVLFMSGYTDNSIVHHGVLEAGTAFIEKPLRPAVLLAKVRDVLNAPLKTVPAPGDAVPGQAAS